MSKRKKLLDKCSELLRHDFSRTVAVDSGCFVTTIPIESIREIALMAAPPLYKKADVERVAALFTWMHEDRILLEQEYKEENEDTVHFTTPKHLGHTACPICGKGD